jgi:hypothetical protein
MARGLRLPQHGRARLPRYRSRTCLEIVTDDLPLLRAAVENELNVKHCANAAFRRPHVARWGLEASPARIARCRRRPRTDEGRRCGDDRCAPAKTAAFLRWRSARVAPPPGSPWTICERARRTNSATRTRRRATANALSATARADRPAPASPLGSAARKVTACGALTRWGAARVRRCRAGAWCAAQAC